MSETLLPGAAAPSLVGTAFSQEFAKVDTVTRKILQTWANTSFVVFSLRWMVIVLMLTEIKPRHSC